MWWSRALLVCSVLALGPSGCGFQPIYGRSQASAPVAAELAGVRVGNIPDRLGQQLRNVLIDRITPSGQPGTPRYILDIKLTELVEGLASSTSGHATISRLSLTAAYVLRDAQNDGYVVANGSSRSLVSMRMLGPRYGSVATERDAEERAISDLAEDIRSQLAARFANGSAAGPRPGQ